MRLEDILGHVSAEKRLRRKPQVMLDTSAWKWLTKVRNIYTFGKPEKGRPYRLVVTIGVMQELERQMAENPREFPRCIEHYLNVLNPAIITTAASEQDEALILRASEATHRDQRRNTRIQYEEPLHHIGWADLHQLGNAMEDAREGKSTVMLTDDNDLRKVVRWLRSREQYIRNNILTASILRYHNNQIHSKKAIA